MNATGVIEPIVALDVPGRRQAESLLAVLGPDCTFVKVGLELFTREGPDVVRWLKGEKQIASYEFQSRPFEPSDETFRADLAKYVVFDMPLMKPSLATASWMSCGCVTDTNSVSRSVFPLIAITSCIARMRRADDCCESAANS